MPAPVVCIVGKTKSGKTTFIEKLLTEMVSEGLRVATVKHVAPEVEMDKPGKDSYRHIAAGSLATVVASAKKLVLVKAEQPDSILEDSLELLGEDYDIVIAEGFKGSDAPKIEIHRKEVGTPLEGLKNRFAIITDEPLNLEAEQFSFKDVKGVVKLLKKCFIIPQQERVNIYINSQQVGLKVFPAGIIASTALGIASNLRGVNEIESLQINVKKQNQE